MKRRSFIRKAAATATAAFAAPYILPSGRLFAQSINPMVDHVVYVLFAGGVRQQEAVYKRYLSDSQGVALEGNVMYNMLPGDGPDIKIVYGTDTADGQPGGRPIDRILSTPLLEQGTLFQESRFSNAGTGHFGGLSTGMSGYYGVTQGLQQRPEHPTIFEYLRRHAGFRATDNWFIGNGIGGSTPLLNHSAHPDYGADYGANFFAPVVTFGMAGEKYLRGFKSYHPDEELDPVRQMRAFLDQAFLKDGRVLPHLNNTEAEKEDIKAFIKSTFDRLENNQIAFPPVHDNNDLVTIGFATEVLSWFKPKLMVVNMGGVDTCHSSFTGYLQALHRADHAVGHLWNFIQTQIPAMAGRTAIIIQPEHGRNLESNGILDENDWRAFDHDSDENSRRIFTMMAGPGIDANLTLGAEGQPLGDAADVVPTIADLFGIKDVVMSKNLIHPGAMSLFDRI